MSARLRIRIAAGVISASHVRADLYELCRGTRAGRARDDRDTITLFENCGGGHLDLMVANHLWRAVQPRGLVSGTPSRSAVNP